LAPVRGSTPVFVPLSRGAVGRADKSGAFIDLDHALAELMVTFCRADAQMDAVRRRAVRRAASLQPVASYHGAPCALQGLVEDLTRTYQGGGEHDAAQANDEPRLQECELGVEELGEVRGRDSSGCASDVRAAAAGHRSAEPCGLC
jgi:hypothetical protein